MSDLTLADIVRKLAVQAADTGEILITMKAIFIKKGICTEDEFNAIHDEMQPEIKQFRKAMTEHISGLSSQKEETGS